MDRDLRDYLVVTGGYWAFTITDGALRMLVLLYFHLLGYTPFQVALLFLFYELFGVVTNLVGGWLGARVGLNRIMHAGMALQLFALAMLCVPDLWLSVPYVMAAQALSGIAKDLNKMSAKAAVKSLVAPGESQRLFRWVAMLTGSKNALKGGGFFVGAALLEWLGFRTALLLLVALLGSVLVTIIALLPAVVGKSSGKPAFSQVFSRVGAINRLAAARFFLFGARDVWFVVALPVYLYEILGWSFTAVGTFMASWVIGYGVVQAAAPRLLPGIQHGVGPTGKNAFHLALLLAVSTALIALAFGAGWPPTAVVVSGLALFGILFAFNSALHSYLILAYSDQDQVALNVGFYYMANAGGRLLGTVLSGAAYQALGLSGCLWVSCVFLIMAAGISFRLPG